MKTNMIKHFIIAILTFVSYTLVAQGPPPPPGNPHGGDDDIPMGGNAPVGNGLAIVLSLGAAYGARKVYYYFKDQSALEE